MPAYPGPNPELCTFFSFLSLFYIFIYFIYFLLLGQVLDHGSRKYSLEQILGQVLGKFAPTQVLG